ncbi:hypothetical protein PYW07_009086 [Mythimna separata]|uniref:Retinol dehydrogenase 12-like n=1 Tax=Mythimna separata TaxID=271217 RepID=A0AAD7YBJ5_MYTSE|nr:hypothetical protein PYW07_009086 [Mythimna separata]
MFPELICFIIFFMLSFVINQKRLHKSFDSQIRIPNKVVIVTGANTGIGFETAKELARRGGRVILACRNLTKAHEAATKIKLATGHNVVVKHLDLASFRSILAFAKDIIKTEGRVHILINNAGTGVLDNSLTEDNLPIEAQVNHFGPFLLTMLLLPVMKNAPETARIINVTSILHVFGTVENLDKQGKNFLERRRVYANTKLANILFTKKLAEEVFSTNDNIMVNCCHPGAVYTDMFRDQPRIVKWMLKLMFLTPKQGAQTSIFLAVQELMPGLHTSGRYYTNCREDQPFAAAMDRGNAQRLWDLSFKVCFADRRW